MICSGNKNGFPICYIIRKVKLTFLINKIHCTQIYYINLARKQIHGKPKRNVFIVLIKMAFRFVYY